VRRYRNSNAGSVAYLTPFCRENADVPLHRERSMLIRPMLWLLVLAMFDMRRWRQEVNLIVLIVVLVLVAAATAHSEIRVSENGRYFVNQEGHPVFWLGTTQWQLFREYTLEEAEVILESAKNKGFAFVQVMLMGVGDGTQPNVYGERPWIGNNPLTPNEPYFRNVDAVVQIAREKNVVISMTLFHQRYRAYITVDNARAWARWVARRYRDVPTIVWSMTPEARQEFVPILRELAAGLREGDGGSHLVTFKPDPAPYSSSFIHQEEWLDFNSMQTWKSVELIYPMVTNDYNLRPVKPVLMAEGAYEQGSEYGFDVTPLWIRRQAYYSYLAGAHHTYGHNDSWRRDERASAQPGRSPQRRPLGYGVLRRRGLVCREHEQDHREGSGGILD